MNELPPIIELADDNDEGVFRIPVLLGSVLKGLLSNEPLDLSAALPTPLFNWSIEENDGLKPPPIEFVMPIGGLIEARELACLYDEDA